MNQIKKERKPKGNGRFSVFIHSRTLLSAVTLALGFVLVFGVFTVVATPKRHDLKAGDIAGVTITATKDVEDTIATQRLRDAAAASIVEGTTKLDTSVSAAVDDEVIGILTTMMQARSDYAAASTVLPTATPVPTPTPTPAATLAGEDGVLTEQPAETPDPYATQREEDRIRLETEKRQTEVLNEFGQKLEKLKLSQEELRAVLTAKEADFDEFCDVMLNMSRETMEKGVREGTLTTELQSLHLQVLGKGLHTSFVRVSYSVLDNCIKENVFIDEIATQEERDRAAASVQPVIYKKGQNIVQAGELVTEQQLAMLSSLGLLENTHVDTSMYVGMASLTALMYGLMLLYLYQFERELLRNPKEMLLLTLILLLVVALGWMLKGINIYLIPVQMGTIIVAMLLHQRLAITFNVVIGVIAGILGTGSDGMLTSSMFHILLMSLFGGAAAVYLSKRTTRRSGLVYAGFVIALVNFVTMMAAGVLTSTDMGATLKSALYGAAGGVLSAVLAVGVIPLLESTFNLVTPQVLLELSTPTHPLLKMLQTEAPGTHHHSLLVANLAEAAATEVGANPLLCRVGAYYHDIGKTRRPIFFKENQIDQPNPHDGMEPGVSAAILAAHVRDGLALADKYKLPSPIKDMIAQHHGDGVMAYFYYNAKKKADEEGREIDIRDYSYDGPKPQTKEAAILMMADTVEAATRTLKDRSRESMSKMIEKLVKDKFESGELNEAPLTFRDLTLISDAFIRTLTGIYHERIEYPNMDSLKKKEN